MLDKNVNRMMAETDMRASYLHAAVQSNEGRAQLQEHLKGEMGLVIDFDKGAVAIQRAEKEFDREGLLGLKNIQFAR